MKPERSQEILEGHIGTDPDQCPLCIEINAWRNPPPAPAKYDFIKIEKACDDAWEKHIP